MQSRQSRLFMTALSLVVAMVAGIASDAAALPTRYFHASTCQIISGNIVANTSGQYANPSGAAATLWCPVITDPTVTLPKTGSQVRMSVWANSGANGNDAVVASVCTVFRNGGGMSCGPSSGFKGPGIFHVAPNTPFVVQGDYVFAALSLGQVVAGSQNSFFGYHLETF